MGHAAITFTVGEKEGNCWRTNKDIESQKSPVFFGGGIIPRLVVLLDLTTVTVDIPDTPDFSMSAPFLRCSNRYLKLELTVATTYVATLTRTRSNLRRRCGLCGTNPFIFFWLHLSIPRQLSGGRRSCRRYRFLQYIFRTQTGLFVFRCSGSAGPRVEFVAVFDARLFRLVSVHGELGR